MSIKSIIYILSIMSVLSCSASLNTLPEFKKFIQKAKTGKPVGIAYLGGSITCGEITYPKKGTNVVGEFYDLSKYNPEKDSWRALTFKWLRDNFEQKPRQFRQINAAIGGTPSLLGAYRLEQDILSEKPDFVFVEFAVNDNEVATLTRENPNAPRSILRTTRSIIERLRERNPNVVIFMPLSTHRVLSNSQYSAWSKILDLSHDQTLLSAESLRIPYVSLRDAFYGRNNKENFAKFYEGADTPGNHVHPAPLGHKVYAESVEKVLSKIFKTGTFNFNLPEKKRREVKPYPIAPQLILPGRLLTHSKNWKIKTSEICEAPSLKNHPCLTASAVSGELKYTFNGSAVALWFDSQSVGKMKIYLDGKMAGIYANNINAKSDFQGRFCSIKDNLNKSTPHTIQLVPVVESNAPPPCIFLRAIAIDFGVQ